MKRLSIVVAVIYSLSTFPGVGDSHGGSSKKREITKSDSWKEILDTVRGDHKLKIQGDRMFVGQVVSAFDVCINNDDFLTTKKFPKYENKFVGRGHDHNDSEKDGWASVVVGYRTLKYPIVAIQNKRVCDQNDKNCRYQDIRFEQDLYRTIEVKKFLRTEGNNSERDIYKTLFKKEYMLPSCY